MTKLRIYTFPHKRPDFIEMQVASMKKHLVGDYEFILFNNANFDRDRNHYNQIHQIARDNGLQCIDVKKDKELIKKFEEENREKVFNNEKIYYNAGVACSYPLAFAYKHYIAISGGLACIIDSDMFLVNKLDIHKIMETNDLVYMPQSRGYVEYMWNGLVFMNIDNLPEAPAMDWCGGMVENSTIPTDVGGHTYYYLNKHKKSLKIKEFQLHHIGEDPDCDFQPANYEYLGLDGTKFIAHFRGGSGWANQSEDYMQKKMAWFKKLIEQS